MQSSKKFGVWCVVAAVVALCMGMLLGTAVVEAQEGVPPQFVYQPPTVQPPAVVQPPAIVPPAVVSTPPASPPPAAVVIPPVANPLPPVPSDLQLYQHYLARLLQINADIAVITAKIDIYEVVAMAEPEDPFIQYELQMLWFQLGMMQMEQTEVRFVLTTLNP